MKRIRRNISPLIIGGLGIWMLLRQDASMTIIGIAVIVLSGLGIVLSVTDKESSKAGKGAHIGLGGICAAGGAGMLIWPSTLEQYLKYILGGIVILYSLLNLRRMIKYRYRMGFRIAECVPVALGAALMLIPLGHDVFTPASGGVMTATGAITLIGNLLGKHKNRESKAKKPEPPQKHGASA